MKLALIVEALALKPLTGEDRLDGEVTGGYASDLLSHVISRALPGQIWVTVQAHPNVVAVALLAGLSAVVIAEDMPVDPVTLDRAREERIPLFSTKDTIFDVIAGLAAAGVGATER